jgi:hypothetical protein
MSLSALPSATKALYLQFPINSDAHLIQSNADILEFRTVSIQPGIFEDELKCFLNCTSTGPEINKDEYCALSYTWGSQDNLARIYLNSVEVPVTQNLLTALRHIRHQTERRIFFIDSLCIDQDDAQEKNVQVRSMWSIYKHASKVVVFLGEKGTYTSTAFEWITALGGWLASLPISKRRYRYTNAPRSIKAPEYALARLGLHDILQRPWWTRVWIIQEVAVASTVSVMCGYDTVPWKYLDAIIGARINSICDPAKYSSVFAWPSPGGNGKPATTALEPEWHPASAIQMARHRYQLSEISSKDNDPGLGPFLIRFRDFQCRDARDKVYGILQLSTKWARIQPDYTKEVVAVYMEAVQSSIVKSQGLAILSTLDYADTDLDRPSWCPNLENGPPNNLPYFQPKFKSSGSTVANVSFDDRVMTITGYRIDIISLIPSPRGRDWRRVSSLVSTLMVSISQKEAAESPYGTDKARRKALKRTVDLISLGYCLKWFKRLQDPHLRYIPCLDADYRVYPIIHGPEPFGEILRITLLPILIIVQSRFTLKITPKAFYQGKCTHLA